MRIIVTMALFASWSVSADAIRTDAKAKSSDRLKHTKWLIGALVVLTFVMVAPAPAALGKSKSLSVVARWYLLVPPFLLYGPGFRVQLQAPLDLWVAVDSTDTVRDCEEQQNNMKRMYISADINSTAVQNKQLIYHYSVCVFSGDPRLANYRFKVSQAKGDALLRDNEAESHDLAGLCLRGAGLSDSTHSSSDARLKNRNMSVPTMLLGVVIIAITGSLCGWLVEPSRNRRFYLWIPDSLNYMSSEPFGQVSNRFKRGSGPSGLLLLQLSSAAGVVARRF